MRNKRKGILMASAILGSAAIVSTGFAAWVITIEAGADAQGTIDVDTVSDESITVTLLTTEELAKVGAGTDQDTTVKFGASEKTITSNFNWLTPTPAEDLNSTIYVKVVGSNFLDSTPFTYELTETSSSLYSAAVSAKYVTELDSVKEGIEQNVVEVTGISGTNNGITTSVYKISLEFGWGDYFNNANPTNYYNAYAHTTLRSATGGTAKDYAPTDDLLTDVKNVLMSDSSAYQKLGEATFNLKITPKRKTNA